MNERLKELALQAGFETLPGKLKVSFGDNEPTTSEWEYPHEKFAELIDGEFGAKHFAAGYIAGKQEGISETVQECLKLVKQHFGV